MIRRYEPTFASVPASPRIRVHLSPCKFLHSSAKKSVETYKIYKKNIYQRHLREARLRTDERSP